MVFYFTGTGNSLYVAKRMDEDLRSIPQAIHGEKQVYKAEKIGIVCPVYGHEMPGMVKDFLKKAVFQSEYLFVVLTYGNIHGGAAELAEKELKASGKKADYINTILMVDNFLPGFDMKEQLALEPEKKVEEHIAEMKRDVDARRHWSQPAAEEDRNWHQVYLKRRENIQKESGKTIYQVTENCIGCGICTRVCPAGCIHLEKQKAVHTAENCQMCMACIHHCPENAVRLRIPEKNPNARYHNEHVRLTEIVRGNNQLP